MCGRFAMWSVREMRHSLQAIGALRPVVACGGSRFGDGSVSCDHCVNGLRPLEWTDRAPSEPLDVAVCLCDAGQVYRRAVNEGHAAVPLWRVWCAQHQVPPERVKLMEDVWSASELADAGLRKAAEPQSRAAALLNSGARSKR
jgi:hypothetical protein